MGPAGNPHGGQYPVGGRGALGSESLADHGWLGRRALWLDFQTASEEVPRMTLARRDFIQLLGIAGAAGLLPASLFAGRRRPSDLYELPRFGNVTLLHITDTHAQLNPIYFREPNVNLGIGQASGRAPHLVGQAFLEHFGIEPGASRPMPLPTWTSPRPPRGSGASAALPTSKPCWTGSAPSAATATACCWTAAIPGRARAPPTGPAAGTWSAPPTGWGSRS